MPACADFEDNDGDSLVDYPEDPDCQAAGSLFESTGCENILPSDYIFASGVVNVDTTNSPNNYEGICAIDGNNSGEAMVEMILENPSAVTISIENASVGFDTIIYVRQECEEVESNDFCDDTGTSNEELNFLRLEAGRYFVFVDGWGSNDVGTADLAFQIVPIIQPQCSDGVDNDEDGLTDVDDPSCYSPFDETENDEEEPSACNDGVDNDGDELSDYPNDPDCFASGWNYEETICAGPVDPYFVAAGVLEDSIVHTPKEGAGAIAASCNNGEGAEAVVVIDLAEPSDLAVDILSGENLDEAADVVMSLRGDCVDADTELYCDDESTHTFSSLPAGRYYLIVERPSSVARTGYDWVINLNVTSRVTECNDGADNDEDDLIDDADPGCTNGEDTTENTDSEPDFNAPECFNGLDDDEDGLIDYPQDPECTRASQDSESASCPAYLGDLIVVNGSDSVFVETQGSSNYSTASCASSSSPDVPIAIVIAEPSYFEAIVSTGSFDTVLYLQSECLQSDQEVADACNDDDDNRVGTLSGFSLDRLEPGVYFLVLDGWGANSSGTATVDITITPLME